MSDKDAAFAEYYATRAENMRGTAYLLCGDWHRAEDLVQGAFTKLYLAWERVSRHEVLDAYLRRIIIHSYLDQRRRGWWFRERVSDSLPERAGRTDHTDDRVVLLRALEKVPRRQRAVLVLRYWADLPVEEVARLLDCSPGTVKSQAARGLQTLRELVPDYLPAASTSEGQS
jgi:RNA polymerase sigma-70 factor (sigma-E family)